jgi:DNA-binding response OmpR family regulator
LTELEFALLELLMRHTGEPLSRTVIVGQVWGANFVPESNLVDVYISRLRRKIDDPFPEALIWTEYGVGYCIAAPT